MIYEMLDAEVASKSLDETLKLVPKTYYLGGDF